MRDRTARQPPTKRNLAEWDAEIEEEFQRVVAATKTAGRKKRGQRLVGVPFAFLADVCRSTKGRAPLVVAMLIYRRTCVCGSRTVTLPGAELAELGIGREMKRRGTGTAGRCRPHSDRAVAPGRVGQGDPAVETRITVSLEGTPTVSRRGRYRLTGGDPVSSFFLSLATLTN